MRRILFLLALLTVIVGGVAQAQTTPLTPIANLRGITDSSGRLVVNCGTGCSGSSVTDDDDGTIAPGAVGSAKDINLNYLYNGTNWVRFTGDATNGLKVQCAAGCSGSTFADNAAFTFGTTVISVAGYVFDDTLPNTATENSAAAPRMSSNRVPYGIIRDGAGNERGANVNASNQLSVSVDATVTNQYTHDAALTVGSTTGIMAMGRASAAAPTAVSADGDAVLPWYTRAGAQASEVVTAGAVISATNPLAFRLTDGSAFVTLASDATHDSAAQTSGPQMVGECDDVSTDAVDEGDAAKVRVDCTTRAVITRQVDPCSGIAKTTTAISVTTDTVIIAAAASKKNYICALVIVAGAAEIVSVTEGTGSVCATSEAALVGSTTDANGMSFAANGGLSAVGGSATVIAGITANVDTCLNVSGANRVSGFVTWVQQ